MTDNTKENDDKKVALVTGATRGIGMAIATALAGQGYYVVGTATSAEGASSISSALGANGEGLVLRSDVPDDVPDLFAHCKQGCGLPLVVVNNAGVTQDNLLLRMSEQEWQSVLQTNLGLLFSVSKAALKGMMKARWGRIINLSSVVASMGSPGQANYAASKAGIEGFTRSLALEVASRNITVNSVAPGFIETDMTAALTEQQTQQALSRVPLARMGSTQDISAAVAYLASDNAGYITGITLHVNGGMYLG